MDDFDPISEEQPIKKSNNLIWIIVAVLVVIAVIIGSVIFSTNNPKFIFEKAIDKIFGYVEFEDYETVKANIDFDFEIDGEDEISKLVNKAKLNLDVESSKTTQEKVLVAKLSKSEEELVNAKVKLDSDEKKVYVDLGEFFDKILEVDVSEALAESEDSVSEPLTFVQTLNAKKANAIFKKEIKNQLKNEYFSSEKVKIEAENLNKNTIKISEKDFAQILENICNNLIENESFLECYENPEEIVETLKDMIANIEEKELDEAVYVEVSVYTKGIFKKVERIDIVFNENDEKTTYELTVISDEEISYKVFVDEEQTLEGTLKILVENNKYNIEISAKEDEQEIVIKMITSVVYNEELTEIDTSNTVNAEELSETDMMTIYGNFMGSKLYGVISEITGGFSGLTSISDDENDDETEIVKNENKSDKKTSTKENDKLVTYNEDVVKFKIPDDYEMYSLDSDRYKSFKKETDDYELINVNVSIEYDSIDDYIKEIKQSTKYFSPDYYSNVEISKAEEIEVEGNKFKKIVLSYDYKLFDDEVEKRKISYYANEIDDENLYVVEFNNIEHMTDSEIETFLTIEK